MTAIFAYLPNEIIREIFAYAGVTFKKRNGKYMGQIPKNDPRYVLLCTIPKIRMMTAAPSYFTSCVRLFQYDLCNNMYTCIYLQVSVVTLNPVCCMYKKNQTIIQTNCMMMVNDGVRTHYRHMPDLTETV
jgi:hypothetical protein